MRKSLLVAGTASVLTLLLALMVREIISRPDGPQTTNTLSSSFKTQQQKIAFLQRYAACPSPILATEFHIQYFNNSGGGIPGPSNWDIRFAVKVSPHSVRNWTKDFRPVHPESINHAWWTNLPLADNIWTRKSAPKYYLRPDTKTYLMVYENEGIILKRISTFYAF